MPYPQTHPQPEKEKQKRYFLLYLVSFIYKINLELGYAADKLLILCQEQKWTALQGQETG